MEQIKDSLSGIVGDDNRHYLAINGPVQRAKTRKEDTPPIILSSATVFPSRALGVLRAVLVHSPEIRVEAMQNRSRSEEESRYAAKDLWRGKGRRPDG